MRTRDRLTVDMVEAITKPGRHSDGGGLYLQVRKNGSKYWCFLYRSRDTGKLREMGIGSPSDISLNAARVFAKGARELLLAKLDPIDEGFGADKRVPF